MTATITLPHKFAPRSYQRRVFEVFDQGCTHAERDPSLRILSTYVAARR